jgi:hypothetical protein
VNTRLQSIEQPAAGAADATAPRPSVADILIAIAKIELCDWIDPLEVPVHWLCHVYAPNGHRADDGCAYTAAEAMALAWVSLWAPDGLIFSRIEVDSVPFDTNGWRFELFPPWETKPYLEED